MASLSVAELWASMEESSCRKRYGRDIMSKEYGQVVKSRSPGSVHNNLPLTRRPSALSKHKKATSLH